MLFTFITEHSGSMIIEQVIAEDVERAIRKWNVTSRLAPKINEEELGNPAGTPVTGVQNVWCFDGIDQRDIFFRVHVVATRP